MFQGKRHWCSVDGLQVPTGLARVSGAVHGLKEVADFAGTYQPTGDDMSLGMGHLPIQNDKGVQIILSAFGQVEELKVVSEGVVITLRK